MHIYVFDMSINVKLLSANCMGNALNIINIHTSIITFFQRTLAEIFCTIIRDG